MKNDDIENDTQSIKSNSLMSNIKAAGQAVFGLCVLAALLPVDLMVAGYKRLTANTAVRYTGYALILYAATYTVAALTPTKVGEGIRYWATLSMERSLDNDIAGAYEAWGKSLIFTPRPGIFTRAANALW